jgi:hypothetical protein
MTREVTYDEFGGMSIGTPGFTGGQPSLRDQFAMAALTGLIGSYAYPEEVSKRIASTAYVLADSMLKARKGGDETLLP